LPLFNQAGRISERRATAWILPSSRSPWTGTAASPMTILRCKKRRGGNNTKRWDLMIEKLREYHEKYGHSLVKEAQDPELYKWSLSIRRNYRHQIRGKIANVDGPCDETSAILSRQSRPHLSLDKLQILKDLDFVWDVQSVQWNNRYQQLKDFWTEHGHCRVPATYSKAPGLGVWVRNQRREYRKLLDASSSSSETTASTLTPERLVALEALNFTWCKSQETSWETRYRELQVFYQTYGHANVPESYPTNPALGAWCINQRSYYRQHDRGQSTGLTEDRIKRLNEIGFKWNYREEKWNAMKERLRQYHADHGHINISTVDEANSDLRTWLIRQRFHFNRKQEGFPSPLTEERQRALEDAITDFSWKGREGDSGPSSEDWARLFDAMRDKGIQPGMRPKQHWFEGTNPFAMKIKDYWTEQDLWELWHQEEDDD